MILKNSSFNVREHFSSVLLCAGIINHMGVRLLISTWMHINKSNFHPISINNYNNKSKFLPIIMENFITIQQLYKLHNLI